MLAPAAFPALFLTLAGFILFLLVTLSVPHIKSIYLLTVGDNGSNGSVDFGVFGACYRITNSLIAESGMSSSACTESRLGYAINFSRGRLTTDFSTRGTQIIQKALSAALVMNPIAAGLAGLSLIWSFCAWFFASRVFAIITFISLLLSALFGWLAFALDIALAVVVRNKLEDAFNLRGSVGNGVWMALGGAVALSLALCAAGCGVFGRYSSKRRNTY